MASDKRGGRREGAGRPPTGTALHSLTVRLTPEQIDRLRELGNGNASRGVRTLLDYGSDKEKP